VARLTYNDRERIRDSPRLRSPQAQKGSAETLWFFRSPSSTPLQRAFSTCLVHYSLDDWKLLEFKGQEEGAALQSALESLVESLTHGLAQTLPQPSPSPFLPGHRVRGPT